MALTDVGGRVQYARMLKGWSGRELARRAGCPPSAVSKIEQGEQETSKHLPAIAAALDVTLAWLVLREGDMPAPGSADTVTALTQPDDDVQLPDYFDPRFPLGPNAGRESAPELPTTGVSRSMLAKHGLDAETCFAMSAVETVPAAGVSSGDDLVLDASDTNVDRTPGRVFAFVGGGEALLIRQVFVGVRGEAHLVTHVRDDGTRTGDVVPAHERDALVVAGRVRYVGAPK